jgi:hypothetical protein
MNKLSPRQKAATELAGTQRKLCLDWLLYIMALSSVKTRTKADLRSEAIERLKISKNAFDFAWIDAIEKTGNHHWYEPLARYRKRKSRTMLA